MNQTIPPPRPTDPQLDPLAPTDPPRPPFEVALQQVLGEVGAILTAKNRAYGNSALAPLRIFSQASSDEAIAVRLDDKLSRIANAVRSGQKDTEDSELDLLGYLILRRVGRRLREGGAS
jgi:hypothetical protein